MDKSYTIDAGSAKITVLIRWMRRYPLANNIVKYNPNAMNLVQKLSPEIEARFAI